MRCAKCQELWQRQLDVPSVAAETALDQHLRDCALCMRWGEGVRRVTDALHRLPEPPRPRPDLAEQMVRTILAERRVARRRVRLRWAVGAAVAASFLFAVVLRFVPSNNPGAPTKVARNQTPAPMSHPATQVAAVPIEESSVQATHVLASMLDRARKNTDDQMNLLRPVVAPFDGPAHPVEPAESPLSEAGQGVVQGFEPVSGSARRAVGLFLRDLAPSGMDENPGL